MILDSIIIAFYSFGRSCIGIIVRPYETYRNIVFKGTLWELLPIGMVLSCYFAIATLVKTAAFRPYILTKQFIFLSSSAAVTYFLIIFMLFLISKLINGKGTMRALSLGWAYTLIPTVLWFLMTSILYVVLPPPRTTQMTGILFSVCYLVISAALLFWKLMLSYLTLRFSMHLDLMKIIVVAIISSPLVALLTITMYRLGVFRVPFI